MLITTFAEVVEKLFREPKLILKSPKLIDKKLLLYRYLLKNQRLKQHIFDTATLSSFTIRDFTIKET